jgi:hypothetical protein
MTARMENIAPFIVGLLVALVLSYLFIGAGYETASGHNCEEIRVFVYQEYMKVLTLTLGFLSLMVARELKHETVRGFCWGSLSAYVILVAAFFLPSAQQYIAWANEVKETRVFNGYFDMVYIIPVLGHLWLCFMTFPKNWEKLVTPVDAK